MMKDSLCSRGDKRTGRSEHIAAAGWRNAAYYFSLSLANEHFFFVSSPFPVFKSRDSTSKNV